ncbi:MAG: type III-B CRISPR module RAMP protein Cmr1 [Chlorobium sp.]|nr:type III-B CRISPR module RAMP protein Cmr1 [Chlorobium sp.]
MSVNIARFYKREKIELNCEIITPMFLGNASQEAELRAAPFKGLLRYWWRVANGAKYGDHTKLLDAENTFFGSPDEKTGGKSQVTVEVTAVSRLTSMKNNFSNPGQIDHPECEKSQHKTNPLNYLAGMGLIHFKNGMLHSYFAAGEKFQLKVEASLQAIGEVQSALTLLGTFGAIGSRSRNGWGSFQWQQPTQSPQFALHNFASAFDRDYPHCLGKDSNGALCWKTQMPNSTWELCMKDLAEIYVSLRAGNNNKQIHKLEVNQGNPPDRHLLGYPVTNHNVALRNWGNQGRHGSALRLIVRKEADGHRGYILHLPHLFSKEMWSSDTKGKERQIQIWQQVHSSLDKLCQRQEIKEERS